MSGQGVDLFRSVGDPRHTAYALLAYGAAANMLGKPDEAQKFLSESLQLSRTLNDKWGIGSTLRNLGLMLLADNHAVQAETMFRESVSLFREMGDRWAMSQALLALGEAAFTLGAREEARQVFLEALQTAIQIQGVPFALEALLDLAAIAAQSHNPESALEMTLYVLRDSACPQGVRERAEQLRIELEAQLTSQQIEAARSGAHSMTLESWLREFASG